MGNDLTRAQASGNPSADLKAGPRPLLVWQARPSEIRVALSDGPLRPLQVAGELERLRVAGVGYWEDLTPAQMRAALEVWCAALDHIPAPFALEAFRYWATRMTRKPSPAEIAIRAQQMMGDGRRTLADAESEPEPVELTPEEIERRRQIVRRLAAEFPILKGVPK